MKARKLIPPILAALLMAGLVVPSTVVAKGKKAKPLVVGTDPADDWGANTDPTIAPLGGPLGQELVEASISGNKKTINFIFKVTQLPPNGGAPEITRYIWDFNVDGKFTELDGKWTNYSRGICDPTSGQCPPPRDPGQQPFIVRANCAPDPNANNITVCEEVGIVQAQFDAGSGTITIPVPAKLIKAKAGSKISPAPNIFGGSLAAAPSAFLTSAAMPLDTLTVVKTFVVPKK